MIKIKPEIHVGRINIDLLRSKIIGVNLAIVCSNSVYTQTDIGLIIDQLSELFDVKVFKNVRADAPFSDLQNIIDEYGEDKPDTIIAIGGGSVLDACKALSVCFYGISIGDLFYKKTSLPQESINLIAIPTTAGTGAELSFGAILFDDKNKIKGGIRGEVLQANTVFIDVHLYKTAPKSIIAEVGFDSLTHAIETYISIKSDSLIRYQSISSIRTVFQYLPKAVNGDLLALEQMAISSAIMGINLAYSSTCLPHRIQYTVGPLTKTSHAQGLIALYNGWLKLLAEDKEKSGLLQMEKDLGDNFDLLEEIEKLKNEINISHTLTSLGVNINNLEAISLQVTGTMNHDPCYKDENTVLKVLQNSI